MAYVQERIQEQPELATVLGLPVHLLPSYTNWLLARLKQGAGAHVVTLNAEMAMQAEQDPELARIIHQAELVIPDGSGVVLYLQLLAGKRVARCPGIELAETLIRQAAQTAKNTGHSVFLYGSAPGVAQTAADQLRQQIPGLNIVGIQHGFLPAIDQPQFQQALKQLQPQIILVGLGVPRQEFWIAENRHLCPNAIWIGVGGSFDIWAGSKVRAPEWLRNNHLEWTYRLYQEPWRWRRMLALPKFAWRSWRYEQLNRSKLLGL
jgi:N-acetylglucosaminyldiphosphoundecaprenol N-acetyl-beta-D-mannosaminyltransferase